MSATPYPKRLIEVDLPIKEISAHARREKSIRHGHISTLHIWWARRPLAACRAVLCASLWPDPADEHCPEAFRISAAKILSDFAEKVRTDKQVMELCAAHWSRWRTVTPESFKANTPATRLEMRTDLLNFIADFANWDAGNVPAFTETSGELTRSAHRALGGSGSRPMVSDPFAGGGAIPVEALRVGADATAADLNPVAVTIERVLLDYLPHFGTELATQVAVWGARVKHRAEAKLADCFPRDPDGSVPVAYLWARTIHCEGPGCGLELPLLRSLVLSTKDRRPVALALSLDKQHRRLDFGLLEGAAARTASQATMKNGAAICPACGYTTPNPRVRAQLAARRGGTRDARLIAVAVTSPGEVGRHLRLPQDHDVQAVANAKRKLGELLATERGLSSVPDELVPTERPSPNARGLSAVTRMGVRTFGDLFTERQLLTLLTHVDAVREAARVIKKEHSPELAIAVQTVLALAVDRLVDISNSLCRWKPSMTQVINAFARQAVPIVWDFAEASPLCDAAGDFATTIGNMVRVLEREASLPRRGTVHQASATSQPLPNDSVQALVTDPPYYDAVPYADLSDFFYVWMRRTLHDVHPALFSEALTPKDEEAIWNPGRCVSSTGKPKDKTFYERQMALALGEGRRVVEPGGVGVVVFAHKSTAGWEAILAALLNAGWVATASWPIDTEMGNRVNAMGTASLASSVHIVCRPRDAANVGAHRDEVGTWRGVLAELPRRIHEWMPRLAREGVVGADAIFACIGPALEVFSRYSRVEKASGEAVELKEYLEQVWAAVSKEALSMIFEGADATGLEEDARLTAMWLWTLSTGVERTNGMSEAEGDQDSGPEQAEDEDEDSVTRGKPLSGFILEFDAARKIAQGLGAHLEKLTGVVEVKGDKARLLAVAERAKLLFSKDGGAADEVPTKGKTKAKPSKKQLGLFGEIEAAEREGLLGKGGVPKIGETTLDRVHQVMILFGAGRSEALKRFVVEEGVGKDARFWKLAQSLSALYPSGSDEKRWVDGVLARKKSLGF